METGIVFDVKEFAVFDGPGIRTTVFLKGCPLHCQWCHNPEGLSALPQLMVSRASCTHCGACRAACPHPDVCTACGACIPRCPLGLRRIAGTPWTSEALAERLLRDADLYAQTGGGVTFSGGEPLMQWPFVADTIARLRAVHTAVETSGYAPDSVFEAAMRAFDLVMLDVKLTDPARHRHYTGVDNAPILRHARMLQTGDTPYILRVPLIPGVNDDEGHLASVAELAAGGKKLVRVELLPYHQTAGAKYEMAGMDYRPEFDTARPVTPHTEAFSRLGVPVCVL